MSSKVGDGSDPLAVNVPEDVRFLTACRAGNAQAFSSIVRKYQDRVFNLTWRLLGNYEDARDVTQVVFVKAYESLDSFRGGSSLYTWLYRIAVNTALDERKRQWRRPEQNVEDVDGLPSGSQYVGASPTRASKPVDRLLADEQQERIAQAITTLDPEYRAVVVLRDVEGLNYGEISAVLGLPAGTVKSRLHRGRMLLRDRLKDLVS